MEWWEAQKHHAKPLTVQNLHDKWRAGGEVRFQDPFCIRVISARPVAKKSKKLKGTGDWDQFMKAVVMEEQISKPGSLRVTNVLDFIKWTCCWRKPLPPMPGIKEEPVALPPAVGDKRPADAPAEDPTAEKRLQLTTGDQAALDAGPSGTVIGGTGDGAGPSGAGIAAGTDAGDGGPGHAGGADDDDDDDDDVAPGVDQAEELGGQKLGVLRQAFADTWATISGPMLTAQDLKRALQQMADFKDTVADQSSALEAVVHIANAREAIAKPTEPGLVITIDD